MNMRIYARYVECDENVYIYINIYMGYIDACDEFVLYAWNVWNDVIWTYIIERMNV